MTGTPPPGILCGRPAPGPCSQVSVPANGTDPTGTSMLLPRLITKLVGWAVSVFYRVERDGPPLHAGPVLVAANHPNALVDPLVVFRTGGRITRPLAKAPLFDQALVGTVLRGLEGLPVFRREDDPSKMHLNDRTFDAAVEALHRGEGVQIYPEGFSHSGPSLAPLRTGAARIALMAEERRGWSLGLHVQPVGLTYAGKHLFGGGVLATYGEPFPVAPWRDAYERDPRRAARDLTDDIRSRLEQLTLNLDESADRELIEVAERLYSREKRLVRWRERASLSERFPRLKAFARGLRWLKNTDPEEYAALGHAVRRYLRLRTLLGAEEADVPPRYRPGAVAAYVISQSLFLVLVLPVGLAGVALWALPYLVTRRAVPFFRPKLDQVASYKLSLGILLFPGWLAALTAVAWLLGGPWWALGAAATLPVTGLAAAAWRERGDRTLEDARVFLRAVGNPRGRDRLAEARSSLVARFDAVARRVPEPER